MFCAVGNYRITLVSFNGMTWVAGSANNLIVSRHCMLWSSELGVFVGISSNSLNTIISKYVKQTSFGNGGDERFYNIQLMGGLTCRNWIFFQVTGYFAGGISGTTGYFSSMSFSGANVNTLTVSGTGTFNGGMTGSSGYLAENELMSSGNRIIGFKYWMVCWWINIYYWIFFIFTKFNKYYGGEWIFHNTNWNNFVLELVSYCWTYCRNWLFHVH